MEKDKLREIVKKSVEKVWYEMRTVNPVEEQTNILTEMIWDELQNQQNNSVFIKKEQ